MPQVDINNLANFLTQLLSNANEQRQAPVRRAGTEDLVDTLHAGSGSLPPNSEAQRIRSAWGATAIRELVVVAGNQQIGIAGQPAAVAPKVVVRNGEGTGIANVEVRFAVSGGGGTLAVPDGAGTTPVLRIQTDVKGEAALLNNAWTLGDRGENSLTVSAGSLFTVFTARAATKLEATTATELQGPAGEQLAPLGVRVADSTGNPVAGVTVNFTAGGKGAVNPKQGMTNLHGIAQTTWKLGDVGANRVIATIGALSVEFRAQATAPVDQSHPKH